jgi:hypothetical protein
MKKGEFSYFPKGYYCFRASAERKKQLSAHFSPKSRNFEEQKINREFVLSKTIDKLFNQILKKANGDKLCKK